MLKCFPCIVESRDGGHPNPHNVAETAVTYIPSLGAVCTGHLYRAMNNADENKAQREAAAAAAAAAEEELAEMEREEETDAGTRPGPVGQGES